jgi:hypothetical protein
MAIVILRKGREKREWLKKSKRKRKRERSKENRRFALSSTAGGTTVNDFVINLRKIDL